MNVALEESSHHLPCYELNWRYRKPSPESDHQASLTQASGNLGMAPQLFKVSKSKTAADGGAERLQEG